MNGVNEIAIDGLQRTGVVVCRGADCRQVDRLQNQHKKEGISRSL